MTANNATGLDYVSRVLRVIVHIESHLDEELKLEELARLAHFSPCHFHRVFRAVAGEALGAFIQRLRIERASLRLKADSSEVTEIAMDAGYENPSAFSRAFKRRWGTTPTAFRERAQELCRHLEKQLKEKKMHVDILKREESQLLFVRRTGDYHRSAPAAFEALYAHLAQAGVDRSDVSFYAIGHDDPDHTDEDKVRYDACVANASGLRPFGDLASQRFPAGRYARFLHKGPLPALAETYDYIYGKWLPNSGEKPADRPCIIEYREPPSSAGDENTEVFVYLPLQA